MISIEVTSTKSNTLISTVARSQVDDLWDEFLRLQISNETKRTYAGIATGYV